VQSTCIRLVVHEAAAAGQQPRVLPPG
jgi:hypothetical protein